MTSEGTGRTDQGGNAGPAEGAGQKRTDRRPEGPPHARKDRCSRQRSAR
jgi:hypothetical protein